MRRLTVADFFCGAGGFSEGFRQKGFDVVFSLDNWAPAKATHDLNHPKCDCVLMNILELDTPEKIDEVMPDVDVIIGSPPCVAFSGSNKAGKADKTLGIKLIEAYLRIVAWKKKKGQLKYWMLENVPNSEKYIKKSYSWKELGLPGKGPALDIPEGEVLNAADYGAPQTRKRYVCGEYPKPEKTHEGKWVTMKQVIAALGENKLKPPTRVTDPVYGFKMKSSQVTDHFYDSSVPDFEWKRAKRLKVDHGYMGKMSFPEDVSRPSRTVMATQSSSTRESIIFDNPHSELSPYRRPTIREISSFMSFPINYQWEASSESSKYKLVGNAVCPRLSAALAHAILKDQKVRKIPEFVPLDIANTSSLNLKGRRLPLKEAKPKRLSTKFAAHVTGIKIGGMRADLTNEDSNFNKEKIEWKCKLRYGTAKTHKSKVVTAKDIEPSLRNLARFNAFKKDVSAFITKNKTDALSLQMAYCNMKAGTHPDDVLEQLSKIVKNHSVADDVGVNKLGIGRSSLPAEVALATYACARFVENID